MADKKSRNYFPPKEVQEKIDSLLESGQALHYEQDIPLTVADVRLIRGMFLKVTLLCLGLSVPLVAVIYFVNEETVWVICGVLLLCLGYILIRAAVQLFANLRTGKKTIVRGIITDRFTRKKFGPQDEDGHRDVKTVYFLQIGTREFPVSSQVYGSHKTGKAIELEYVKAFNGQPFILHHRKLPDAGMASDKKLNER